MNIKSLAQKICADSSELAGLTTTVEKELLHYEVLASMAKHGFLKQLTFQGGTCLRMMYGSSRLSEDLDFVGGADFDFDQLAHLRDCLHEDLSQRHNLKVNVTEPNYGKLSNKEAIQVGRWKISIETEPDKKSLPWQKVKLEVATVIAHTQVLRPLVKTYPSVPDAYVSILLNCETLEEIAADKFVALALRRSIKARDVWDIAWLNQRNVQVDAELVRTKFQDYHQPAGFEALSGRLQELPSYMASGDFQQEMRRFLHSSTVANSIEQDGFIDYLTDTVIRMGDQLLREQGSDSPKFKM
ncbi:nucleotidyltransferase AbiEii toxin of type IV toxin-antitoxin system [Idiomarina loihiensis]|uniref:nucleotidyl transferase AbiEii/AbiGii toxin family protein n=1 Tax=Idiomarina TaxID=135575 RepID=UPI000D70DAC2|nr:MULTISPECIES: nucleotidyl transferase AbiEii/AbiGii toxin family protein [Idiomarina]PWW37677.1 nucleotidyltransferase AbiEii toxin of type IV toxin-antitoxin system [Idiomarina loihiensis]TDP47416.1 nucleotidyltransferase AbiEii toxin of type IV toxin-antitoxin system [Idiomarina loihiensis]TDS23157.1 nucleotidyltransferase AbiEii toxin of type IV toxin-antitoxin system [Idiomarina sp. H2]